MVRQKIQVLSNQKGKTSIKVLMRYVEGFWVQVPSYFGLARLYTDKILVKVSMQYIDDIIISEQIDMLLF